ncbi:MAG: CAP domain-containing protein [Chloroflexales bacterium]
MHSLTRALLTLLALALTGAWAMTARIHAADPAAANAVYLPLVACTDCTGTEQVSWPPPTIVLPQPTRIITPTPVPGADAAEVIRLVNIERATVGCPAVVADTQLIAATQAWADYMAATNVYHHATASWYAPYGYPSGVRENLGVGMTPAMIVEAWMTSKDGHRQNLLWCYSTDDPSYHPADVYVVGVGHSRSSWVWGMTLSFTRR